MTRLILALTALLAAASHAAAHFVFVVPQPGGASARVVFSETLEPDEGVEIESVGGAALFLRGADGKEVKLDLASPAGHAFEVKLGDAPAAGDATAANDATAQRVIRGSLVFGVQQRGQSPAFLLTYHPKAIVGGDPFDPAAALGDAAVAEIVPTGKPGALAFRVLLKGKPVPAAKVTVILPDGKEKEVATGDDGQTPAFAEPGRYGVWARCAEDAAGEHEGEPYTQVRHYPTLVVDVGAAQANARAKHGKHGAHAHAALAAHEESAAPAAAKTTVPHGYGKLPEATSSFGASACDGWLYVYGGHIAPTHHYDTKAVSGRFHRIRLTSPNATNATSSDAPPTAPSRGIAIPRSEDRASATTSDEPTRASAAAPQWEPLPDGPALQGMNTVAHGGKVYRIGGMRPLNAPGDEVDNHSVADNAAFDPATGAWAPLPPLPAPRSSHDVVAVGDKLFVVGGWTMKGEAGNDWPDSMLVLDLAAAEPKWSSLPQPFQRRALIASVYQDKIYVIGGFDEHDKPTLRVDVYDPATGAWSAGPALPGKPRNGFAPAACTAEGQLYVSVADGTLYCLAEADGASADANGNGAPAAWRPVARTTPRIVHRLIPHAGHILVLGGATKGDNLDLIEAVPVSPPVSTPEAPATCPMP